MASNIMLPQVLQIRVGVTILSSFLFIGVPIIPPVRMFRLINNTDGDMVFSLDGIHDQFFVPANSFVLYDVAGNSGQSSNFRLQGGSQFYVRFNTPATKNNVYVEYICAKGE
jgi:hypothetical protein